MEAEHYYGVSYHPRDKFYLANVAYKHKHYWLKTWDTAYKAAQVRDVAARWLKGTLTKLNDLPTGDLPEGVTEAVIARWLIDAGVPLRVLVYRVPMAILSAAGITEYQLLQAGVSAGRILKFKEETTNT